MACEHDFSDGVYFKLQPLPEDQDKVYCPNCDKTQEKCGIWNEATNLYFKVNSILQELHYGDFLHISNGEEADVICGQVVEKCMKAGVTDQGSILHFIFTNPNLTRFMGIEQEE